MGYNALESTICFLLVETSFSGVETIAAWPSFDPVKLVSVPSWVELRLAIALQGLLESFAAHIAHARVTHATPDMGM